MHIDDSGMIAGTKGTRTVAFVLQFYVIDRPVVIRTETIQNHGASLQVFEVFLQNLLLDMKLRLSKNRL